MRSLLSIVLALGIAGCASQTSAPKMATSFFPLRELEGKVEEEVVRLPSFPGPSDAWIAIVIAQPEEFRGLRAAFRFSSDRDPNYRLLAANRGRRFRVTAKDGRGIVSRSEIVFVSDHPPVFTPLKEEPNKTPEPTPTAVMPAAEQPSRRP